MIYGITYADDKMSRSARFCMQSMINQGVNRVDEYCERGLNHGFIDMNKDIFDGKRGAGCYWLFKPFIIHSRINEIKDNDILIYADAGIEFVNSVHHIIDRMDEDIFLFTNTHPNHHWTKRYTLDAMMPGWERRYEKDTPWPQVQASVIFIKVNEYTRNFIKTWLLWCQMPGIINDWKGALPEYPFFQDHRHDQSVLSVLATQENFRLHWWPTAYAEHIRVPGDTYPVLFNHHRRRDKGHGEGVNPEWE